MSGSDLPRLHRRAARLLLLDERDRVLLLHGRDPGLPDGPAWWFTPGGGIDEGEDAADAARRECWEELGMAPLRVHGPIAHRCYEFPFDGRWLIQDTTYFWARVQAFEPAPMMLTELERRFIIGWRWWTRDALACTTETIYPEDLQKLLTLSR